MAITKMRLMNIITDKQHLEEMLLRFSTLDNFHPELANKIVDRVSGLAVLNLSLIHIFWDWPKLTVLKLIHRRMRHPTS